MSIVDQIDLTVVLATAWNRVRRLGLTEYMSEGAMSRAAEDAAEEIIERMREYYALVGMDGLLPDKTAMAAIIDHHITAEQQREQAVLRRHWCTDDSGTGIEART